jgi:hemin transport system permease protein
MRLAWRELLRRPRSFVVPLGIMQLIALLLLYPGAVLDGIVAEATDALRHAPGDLVVYSREANGVGLRSRIEPATRGHVAKVDDVTDIASFDVTLLTGRVAGHDEPVPFALLASDRPVGDVVPGPGEALADTSLRGLTGMDVGAEVAVGPLERPLRIVGFADHLDLWFGRGLVVDEGTWAGLLDPDPGAGAAPGDVSQALLVEVRSGADLDRVATQIDQQTAGLTQTFTRTGAIEAMPGVRQQQQTFGLIRAVTLGVALMVVGLYLSFVTLDRSPLYAVLKAVGASSRQLFGALLTQVTAMSDIAVLLAVLVAIGLTHLPLGVPARIDRDQVIATALAMRTVAAIATALSLRRVVRIDPAEAVG